MNVFHRLRREYEEGMSLVEVMVATMLVGAVVAIFGPVLTSSLASGNALSNESRGIDQIRLAVARIDRELRSASSVTAPACNSSGSQLTFVVPEAGGNTTVTYAVQSGSLTRTENGTTQQLGEGLVVTSKEFTISHHNAGLREEIGVSLTVQFDPQRAPRLVATTITGRNDWGPC